MQTRLLRCECKQLDKLIRRRVVANATQIIRQLIYQPFQDVSDLTVSHLALLEQLLGALDNSSPEICRSLAGTTSQGFLSWGRAE